ncbi:MAG: hypothetical protein J7M26_00950, partial [Armatimonadetes bacterium]|nr:hypothetical protein [Armatimonadota bacterium]
PELKDLLDFFLPEIYLNYTGYNVGRFDDIIAHARKCGVFEKMLVGLGINVVKNKDGSIRCRPTPEEIVEEIRYLKQIAPDLRGLAFFTYGSAEPAVRAAVDRACRDYFLVPVADLVKVRAVPELARPGRRAEARCLVRNAGAMPGRGFEVSCWQGDEKLAVTRLDLGAGEERTVRLAVVPPVAAGELRVEVSAPAGGSRLRTGRTAPVVRMRDVRAVFAAPPLDVPSPPGPVWLALPIKPSADGAAGASAATAAPCAPSPSAPVAAVAPLSALGKSGPTVPCDVIAFPDGERFLCWQAPALPARHWCFWRALEGREGGRQRDGKGALTVHRSGTQRIEISTPVYHAVLDCSQDALVSLQAGPRHVELLKSPWRVSWKAWQGFGKAQIREGQSTLQVTVPVEGKQLSGWSSYVFYPQMVEIRRRFRVREGALVVASASEGARIEQREGTFALQFGVGARPSRGRLQVASKYRDLYFGSRSLGPEAAKQPGWFDFSWLGEKAAGLGVAIGETWRTRGSRAGYDVTRYYDGSDWIEVAYVWGGKETKVTEGASRLFLVPHGPLDLEDEEVVPPAQALWLRLHAPARRLTGQ